MDLRFGRFELRKRIGAGGMAEVFLAVEHLSEGAARLAVLKRILPRHARDPDFVEFFVQEAKLALALQHPNVVHAYDFGEEDGVHYLAMEYVHGETLLDVVRRANERGRTLSLGTVVKITCDLLAGLDHTHNACDLDGTPLGIVHRDVTPQNILVSHQGAVKLADFGVARTEAQAFRTRTGVVKGKFSYLAPEVLARGKRYDHRVDLFALGIVMYESMTGRSLFRGKNDGETVQRISRAAVPPITRYRPDCPPGLAHVIERALERDPEHRWPSAAAMLQALDEASCEVGLAANVTRLRWELSALFPDEQTPPTRPDTVTEEPLLLLKRKDTPSSGERVPTVPTVPGQDKALDHFIRVASAMAALPSPTPPVQMAGTLQIALAVAEPAPDARPVRRDPTIDPALDPAIEDDELPPPIFPTGLLEAGSVSIPIAFVTPRMPRWWLYVALALCASLTLAVTLALALN
jgi:eukaryotic-like serine/threonine-protein kinase